MTTPAQSDQMRRKTSAMLERRRRHDNGEPNQELAKSARRMDELETEMGLKRTVRRADIRCKACGIVGRATVVTVEVVGTVSVWVGLPSGWWVAMPVDPENLHCRCDNCLRMHERGGK